MSLTRLVKYRNDIQEIINQLSLDDAILEKVGLLNKIETDHADNGYDFGMQTQISKFKELIDTNGNIIKNINSIITSIELEIDSRAPTIDVLKSDFLLPTNPDLEAIIQSRINKHSEFHYPGLQMCRYLTDKSWQNLTYSGTRTFATPSDRIQAMLASDPLYLLGKISDLEEMITIFPEQYQRRLRLYESMAILPQNQFGLILCWDILNYYSLDKIEHHLKEFIKLLRPGGTLIFSYNNCSIEKSSANAENSLAGWAPDRLIKKLSIDIGYEISVFFDYPANDILDTWVSWCELKKPGTLTTVKRTQSQGMIKSK